MQKKEIEKILDTFEYPFTELRVYLKKPTDVLRRCCFIYIPYLFMMCDSVYDINFSYRKEDNKIIILFESAEIFSFQIDDNSIVTDLIQEDFPIKDVAGKEIKHTCNAISFENRYYVVYLLS